MHKAPDLNKAAAAEVPDLITAAQAAELLHIDRSWLTRQVQAGEIKSAAKLPGIRGAYLFDRAEIQRVLEERAA